MRVALTGDDQPDERSRFGECVRVQRFIAEDARERGCVAFLHSGDAFERRSTEAERAAVHDWISRVAYEMPVVICGGNHEAAGEVTEIERWFEATEAQVFTRETPEVIDLGPSGPCVAVLPWPRRSSLAAWIESMTSAPPSPEEIDRGGVELLRRVIAGLGARMSEVATPDQPRILLAHADVVEHRVGTDQPSRGEGIRISLADLMLSGADAICLGHVHLHQSWTLTRGDGAEVPIIYAGSPRRTAYSAGDAEPKGYVVLTFEGRRPSWEFVPTPASPMLLREGVYEVEESPGGSHGVLRGCDLPEDVTGAEIRLRYTVRPEHRDEARHLADEIARRALARGAADVQVEDVPVPTVRARAPEVAAAPTVTEKVRLVCASRGIDQTATERLVALTSRIEGVCS